MFKLVILSCALTATLGQYAGKKVDTPHSIPKILNPIDPIDPINVRPVGPGLKPGDVITPIIDPINVGPGLKPGDVITPIRIDNVQVGPERLPWIDENLANPFEPPRDPFVDPNFVAKPLDYAGVEGQVFKNPFSGGQGTPGGIVRKKPSYDGSHKIPVPPSLKKLPGYTDPAQGSEYPPFGSGVIKPAINDYPPQGIIDQNGILPIPGNPLQVPVHPVGNPFGPDNVPFGPIIGGGIVDPVNPIRKAPSYDNSHKVPVPPLKKPTNYDGQEFIPGNPLGPFTGGIVNPLNPGNAGIIRKAPSYDNSHKVPVPPVKKPTNYDGPDFFPGNLFGPLTEGIIDPMNPGNAGIIRKAPSYDNSHKVPGPPVKKPTNYDGPEFVPENPFGPFTGGIIDQVNAVNAGIIRKAPSYDNSHKIPVPPVKKPTNYDGPEFVPENPFGPFTGGIIDPLNTVNAGIIRKAPSYDNSQKIPVPPVKKPTNYDGSEFVPGNPFGPLAGGVIDPLNPVNVGPIRKAPSYDNSHKPLPGQVIGGDPLGLIDPVRKAPSYDNSHKLGKDGVIPPVVPASGYDKEPSVPGLPLPGIVADPYSVEAQQDQFNKLVSARLGTRSGISPPSLPVQKKLSSGKRDYLSSLGVFKKVKSYQS